MVMTFKVGEKVVHPQHGVGRVVNLEDREFEPGVIRGYYEISIPGGSTLWAPVDLKTSGLRKLAQRSEIARCRKVLEARPSPLVADARLRQADLADRLKLGTLRSQCEVVRDLYAHGEHKSLYGTIANFFRTAQTVLCQEWAVVEGVTLQEAMQEVNALLEKSRRTMSNSKV